jgi:hypothetical protein
MANNSLLAVERTVDPSPAKPFVCRAISAVTFPIVSCMTLTFNLSNSLVKPLSIVQTAVSTPPNSVVTGARTTLQFDYKASVPLDLHSVLGLPNIGCKGDLTRLVKQTKQKLLGGLNTRRKASLTPNKGLSYQIQSRY